MEYEEALEAIVTPKQAKREILAHCCIWEEFLEDVGEKSEYLGRTVLEWLGY